MSRVLQNDIIIRAQLKHGLESGGTRMPNKGLIPPGMTFMADNVKSKDNILGASKETGTKWAKGLNLPGEAETIFFAGCGYQFSGDLESMMGLIKKMDTSVIGSDFAMGAANLGKKMGIDAAGIFRKVVSRGNETEAQPLRDAVKVLSQIGIKFGYLAEDEPCCGGIVYYAGMQKEFTQHARKVHDRLKAKGVKRIIGLVPSCTYTLRNLMAGVTGANDIEVKHFSEVIAENLSSLDLRYPKAVRVTYHDPCQMGRYLGLKEEPRRILRAIKGIEFVEPAWTKGDFSTCCGGGGGFEAVFPELSQTLAVNRTKELLETKAQIIVTNCPGCIMQLKTGLKALKVDGVEVLDLAEIVAQSLS
jgi:dimethylglycine catabolism B